MKKLTLLLTLICSAAVLGACASADDTASGSLSDNQAANANYDTENGQIRYTGQWTSEDDDEFTLDIYAGDNEVYSGMITKVNDKRHVSYWEFNGTLDGSELSYTNCIRTDAVYNNDGLKKENIKYEDGTGTIIYVDDMVVWKSDNDSDGDGIVFK